jgi:hypothetical protein
LTAAMIARWTVRPPQVLPRPDPQYRYRRP